MEKKDSLAWKELLALTAVRGLNHYLTDQTSETVGTLSLQAQDVDIENEGAGHLRIRLTDASGPRCFRVTISETFRW